MKNTDDRYFLWGNLIGVIGIEQLASIQGLSPMQLELLLEDKTIDEIIDIVRNENPENPKYDISEQALTNLG